MRIRLPELVSSIALAVALTVTAAPATAIDASALAGPLAEQFGVPSAAVTTLLEKGMSLESVTQLLLVSQSSEKPLDQVSSLYEQSDNDIGKTAGQLGVPQSAYSDDVVSSTIDQAKAKLQQDAADQVKDKVLDSVIGGFER